MPAPKTSVSYVKTPADAQRPVAGAYHYHFGRRPEDMARFHERWFAREGAAALDSKPSVHWTAPRVRPRARREPGSAA